MAYLLDANVFISAKNLHYGLDFCPAFWDWLILKNSENILFSIEKVGDEVFDVEDELSEWASNLGPNFFLKPDSSIVPALSKVSLWATSQDYETSAVNTFLQLADYYLVSHAIATGYVIVTHEIPSASKRKIKIPDVCIGLGVKWITPYEMLRIEKARFILGVYKPKS